MRLSGGEKPVIITNSINKTVLLKLYCYHSVIINVIEIKQKSVINCFTKIWQYVASLMFCIDKNKNTKFTGLNILLYG
jgi:hypothetical protein